MKTRLILVLLSVLLFLAPAALAEESVLARSDLFTVTLLNLSGEPGDPCIMGLRLENTSDRTLQYTVTGSSVNGIISDLHWFRELEPGKSLESAVEWPASEVGSTWLEFTLSVYDKATWRDGPLHEEAFSLYPMGEDESAYYLRPEQPGDKVLFDNEYASMIITGTELGADGVFTAQVYLTNRTGETLSFNPVSTRINGREVTLWWALNLPPYKSADRTLAWFTEEFTSLGFDSVTELSLTLQVSSAGSVCVSDTFTIPLP